MDSLTLVLLAVMAVLAVWLLVLSILFARFHKFLTVFTTGVSKKDLKTLLETINAKLDSQQDKLNAQAKQLEEQKNSQKKHLQKVALVRYNPFGNTGGDQSFALSLLDADGSGFVVTSLHSREHTRIYAKEVRGDLADNGHYSREEQEAISQAMKK